MGRAPHKMCPPSPRTMAVAGPSILPPLHLFLSFSLLLLLVVPEGTAALSSPPRCVRIASAEAAGLIREGAVSVVVTSDASGGSGRFHGLCAVLRRLGRAGGGDGNGNGSGGNGGGRPDLVTVVARRTRSANRGTGGRKARAARRGGGRGGGHGGGGVPPELAAACLGIRAAAAEAAAGRRSGAATSVLVLTDCERSLARLSEAGLGSDEGGGGGRRRREEAAEAAAVARSLRELFGGSGDGARAPAVYLAKVASVSRRSQFDGFFDHATADAVSGWVRGVPNAGSRSGRGGEGGGVPLLPSARPVRPLGRDDLGWLETSDLAEGGGGGGTAAAAAARPAPTTLGPSQDRGAGMLRIGRLARRMEEELGVALP